MWWIWVLGYIGIGLVIIGGLKAIVDMAKDSYIEDTPLGDDDKLLECLIFSWLAIIWPIITVMAVIFFAYSSLKNIAKYAAMLIEVVAKKLRRKSGGDG